MSSEASSLGYTWVIEAWDERRPWRARIYKCGEYVGHTGGCKSPFSANDAAVRFVAKRIAKESR